MEMGSWKFNVVWGVLRWVGYVVAVPTYLVGVLTLGFYKPQWHATFNMWVLGVLYGKGRYGK